MNILKAKPNEAIYLQGGLDGDRCGLQCISKGSQQFATEGEYFFFTTSSSPKSFNVKTSGAIYLENQSNYLCIGKNKVEINAHSFTTNCLGDYISNVRGKAILELDKGVYGKISGGDVKLEFMEKMRNFYLNSNFGNVLLENVDNFSLDTQNLQEKANTYNINIHE